MAQQVSIENIEKALKKVDALQEEALDRLIETHTLSQQNLVDYVLQAGLEYQNEDLNVYAIYYFELFEVFLIWRSLCLALLNPS